MGSSIHIRTSHVHLMKKLDRHKFMFNSTMIRVRRSVEKEKRLLAIGTTRSLPRIFLFRIFIREAVIVFKKNYSSHK